MPSTVKLPATLAAAALAAVAGCASSPAERDDRQAAERCPAGHTMTCEVDRIGRIFHGTFRKDVEKCACVPDEGRSLDSPVIPSVQP